VAEDKAKGPEGADDNLTEGADVPSDAIADDDGYTSNADEESTTVDEESAVVDEEPAEPQDIGEVPSGELLADENLHTPEPFELAEDDEELEDEDADDASILAMFHGIDAEDDEERLAQAEEEAAEMESSRPVRKRAPKTEKSAKADAAQQMEDATQTVTAPAKKNRPTRTRAQATQSDGPKKTGPAQFVGQVVVELKKVSWPTSAQLMVYFFVVLVFVVFMIAFIGLLDLLFGWLMLHLFS